MKTNMILDILRRFNMRINAQGGGYFLYYISFIYCTVLFGSSFDDYFRYEFYKKSNYERSKFITYRKSKKLIKKYNQSNSILKVLNKKCFYEGYADYINRDWLDTSSSNFYEFAAFLRKYKSIIVKPVSSGSGKGIWKLEEHEYLKDDLIKIFNSIQGCLVEETIEQHDSLNALNCSLINTVRVLTFFDATTPHIIACNLRMGINGSVVDNLHSGGLCAGIDIDTGIVFTPAVNSKLKRYILHPDSGKKIIGFEVPHWSRIIDTAKKVAPLIPELRYLGWDFAVLNDGVELIEANHDPAHDLSQISDQQGKYLIINKIVHNLL